MTSGRSTGSRLPRAGLLLCFLAGVIVPPVHAEEEWSDARPDDLARFGLHRIVLAGDFEVDEGEIRGVIESSTSGRIRFRAVDLDELERDTGRIRLLFRRNGFWNVEVELGLLFDSARRRVEATFTITPGIQRIVGAVLVEGERTFAEQEILAWSEQRTGQPFDVLLTARDRAKIENTYANRGFYRVKVLADIQPAVEGSDPRIHDLVYRVDEGPRFLVGEVTIQGNVLTKESIVRRELTFGPGDVLNRAQLERSRNRLFGTGYFSRVDIRPLEVRAESGSVDMVVGVRERKMRFVGLGIGYGTRDQLRFSGEWGNRNVWGRGKRASVRGVLAAELLPIDLIRARIEGRFVEPWLFSTRNQGSVTLSFERRREFTNQRRDEYDLNLVRLVLNASRQLTTSTNAWFGLENEWADTDAGPGVELPDDARPDITRSATFTLDRDRRSDFFEPTDGHRQRFISSISGGLLGGDNDFWRVQLEGATYATPFATFAARLRVGYMQPYGQSQIIPDRERFKLGGAASVRGYQYQAIGPGNFMILGNAETRFPLFWLLAAAIFVDGGNAWPDVDDVRWEDFNLEVKDDLEDAAQTEFRYAVGAGLRVRTPVGPIRLDAGRKLKIIAETEDRWGYYLSLGHLF